MPADAGVLLTYTRVSRRPSGFIPLMSTNIRGCKLSRFHFTNLSVLYQSLYPWNLNSIVAFAQSFNLKGYYCFLMVFYCTSFPTLERLYVRTSSNVATNGLPGFLQIVPLTQPQIAKQLDERHARRNRPCIQREVQDMIHMFLNGLRLILNMRIN